MSQQITNSKTFSAMALVAVLFAATLTSACGSAPTTSNSSAGQNSAQSTTVESSSSSAPAQTTSSAPAASPAPETSGGAVLRIKDVKVGKGAAAKSGDYVTVDYTGWLTDGTKFDSTSGGKHFTFRLGQGSVIQGWDQGVVGMRVGGTRQLIIPPALGYGDQGTGGVIPPNATLKFEVKLLAIN